MDVQREIDTVLGELERMILEPPDVTERERRIRLLEAALAGWPRRLRGASYYRAQDDLSSAQIAEIVGCHLDTVRAAVREYRRATGAPEHPRIKQDRYAHLRSTVPLADQVAAGRTR